MKKNWSYLKLLIVESRTFEFDHVIVFILGNFDPSLLDMEPLYDPLDDITILSSVTDDFTNQSTLSYLMSSQSRRLSTGKISNRDILKFQSFI